MRNLGAYGMEIIESDLPRDDRSKFLLIRHALGLDAVGQDEAAQAAFEILKIGAESLQRIRERVAIEIPHAQRFP